MRVPAADRNRDLRFSAINTLRSPARQAFASDFPASSNVDEHAQAQCDQATVAQAECAGENEASPIKMHGRDSGVSVNAHQDNHDRCARNPQGRRLKQQGVDAGVMSTRD